MSDLFNVLVTAATSYGLPVLLLLAVGYGLFTLAKLGLTNGYELKIQPKRDRRRK